MPNIISKLLRFPGVLMGRLSEIALQFLMKKVIPISWHYFLRDSGMFRSIADYGAFLIGLGLAITQPTLPFDLLRTRKHMKFFSYADTYCQVNQFSYKTPLEKKVLQQSHMLEVIDLTETTTSPESVSIDCHAHVEQPMIQTVRPVLVFVHGGAWGSGRTWQYTIIARNLGKLINASHVVLVSYPYYPDATILEQRDSVLASIYHIQTSPQLKEALALPTNSSINEQDSSEVGSKYRPLVLAGHSSGANIIALALFHHFHEIDHPHNSSNNNIDDALLHKDKFVDMFIGLSGVYDIEKHYLYESCRGVQHLSPMGAAAISQDSFWRCSPTLLIQKQLRDITASSNDYMHRHHNFPYVAVIHGDEDDVVPHTSTMEYEQSMQAFGISIDSYYPKVSINEYIEILINTILIMVIFFSTITANQFLI